MQFPSLLTTKEAAKRVRVHPATLNGLIRDGKGPAVTHIGRKALIREDVLAEWVNALTEPAPPEASRHGGGAAPRGGHPNHESKMIDGR